MKTSQKARPSLEVSDNEALSRPPLSRETETGLVVSYLNRSYADYKGMTFLSHLRQYLPNAEYHDALPTRILECCGEVRSRVSADPAQLEMTGTFELGEQTLRFRVVSLTRVSERTPVLILLDHANRASECSAQ